MTLMSVGNAPTKTFILNDSNGLDGIKVFNNKGFLVFEVTSKGDKKQKGKDIKI